jgi:hypothetical protein
MAQHDDWASGLGWSHFQEDLFADLGRADTRIFEQDSLFKTAFDVGWFDMNADTAYRVAAREYVIDTLKLEYDLDFDLAFDWDSWRENYEPA